MSGLTFEYKERIEKEIKRFFARKKKSIAGLSPELHEAVDKLEEFTLRGGKRIRATLVIIGYLGCGGKDLNEIIAFSICAEILHSGLLIQDDVMDNDATRRGGPTVHASYWNKYSKKTSESTAIIIGDIAYDYAIEVILDSKFPDKQKMVALKTLLLALDRTFYGQLLDLAAGRVDEKYINHLHESKSAYYTAIGPLCAGASLARANQKLLKQLTQFGLNAGVAFQLQDDILGAFGNEEEIGKPVGSDFREGKKTLLVEKAGIWDKIGRELTPFEIEEIKKIIVKTGSLAYSQKLIAKLLAKAKTILRGIKLNSKEKEFLFDLVDYLGTRRK